jgi:hypothetical protein
VFLAATESFTVTLEIHPGVDPASTPLPGGDQALWARRMPDPVAAW